MEDKISESCTVKIRGYKVPVMVYVDPTLFDKIEDARGLAKRSTFIEVVLDELFTGGIVDVRGDTNKI